MNQPSNHPPFTMPPFDPAAMQAMWQQMMGQFTSPSAHPQPTPAMPAEILKQMQKACLDTMARWADEYMRSPQFLDQMKQSLEGALAMRRQVEDFIRKASEQSYGSTLGVHDAVGAVRDAESWITRRIDDLAGRLDSIEAKLGVGGGAAGAKRTARKRTPRKGVKKTGAKAAAKKTNTPGVAGKRTR